MDRRFWILGTVIALSTGLPTFVSGQCGSASIQEGNTEIADCDGLGPTSTATTTKFYTMTSAVACQYVSQYGQQFGPTQTSVGAMGMCAHSNFGEPPNCVGVVGPALDQGGGLFHIRSQANFWNPSTLGCELDTPEDVPRQCTSRTAPAQCAVVKITQRSAST
jgi:hypothetical protein